MCRAAVPYKRLEFSVSVFRFHQQKIDTRPPPKEILEDTVGEYISGAASLPPDPK